MSALNKISQNCNSTNARSVSEHGGAVAVPVGELSTEKLSTTRMSSTEGGRGAPPPLSNTGENSQTFRDSGVKFPDVRLILSGGKPTPVQAPAIRIAGEICNIDWLNVVLPGHFFQYSLNSTDHSEYAESRFELDAFLTRVFGTHVTDLRSGRNFYDNSLVIGEGWGFVLHGGQRGTVCLMLTGNGCGNFKEGWEERLHEECAGFPGARITRVDLAHDDFWGVRGNIHDVSILEQSGQFTFLGHQRSEVSKAGNWDHGDPRNKGLTLYVGSTSSGKRCCIYEKGKQLGDVESPWLRYEVRFSNKDRHIPWSVLLTPSHFFAASYPCFEGFSDRAERIEIKKKSAQISYETSKKVTRRQFGQHLNMVWEIEGMDGIKELFRDGIPKRVKVHTSNLKTQPAPMAA